jgi:hypothetical protein
LVCRITLLASGDANEKRRTCGLTRP